MADSSGKPWSDSPNAPRIPYSEYLQEKSLLAGVFLGAILCGIVIVLCFRCVGALLDPANDRTKVVKWGLVVHTTLLSTFAVICGAFYIDFQRVSYIDNREFPGVDGVFPPGPFGYGSSAFSDAISIIPYFIFVLNQWLADGFLVSAVSRSSRSDAKPRPTSQLYRCYVVYSRNRWAVAIPCSMYLASIAMGITLAYLAASGPETAALTFFSDKITLSYLMVSLLLNILLTLMIVARLFAHSRNVRRGMGASADASGLYKSIISILIESCALYAGFFLVYIVTSALKGDGQYISGLFQPILAGTQVIAPLLIIRRVADRSAVTSNTVSSGDPGAMRFRSQSQSTSDERTIPDEIPVS